MKAPLRMLLIVSLCTLVEEHSAKALMLPIIDDILMFSEMLIHNSKQSNTAITC